MGFFSRALLVFLMKESKKRRQKQPGKLLAKSHSQPVNLLGARPLMNPLLVIGAEYLTLPALVLLTVVQVCSFVCNFLTTKLNRSSHGSLDW